MMTKSLITKPQRQTGAVLIISLIMLLAITLIGVTSSNVTSLQEKMAANSKDVNLAFQAAEAALRDVEAELLKGKPKFEYGADTTQGKSGLYSLLSADCSATGLSVTPRDDTSTPSLRPFDSNVDWGGTKVATYNNNDKTTKKLEGLYQLPKYIIEEVSCRPLGSSAGNESLEAGGMAEAPSAKTEVRMRITARGWGSNANSVATVQSVVKITYEN